jgi:imidazole glycerol-phosphate synthase subunit HisF
VLKIRVVPTLLYKEVELVKGIGFDSWRRVGGVMQAVKVYNLREVDELIFLDIQATRKGVPPDFALIDEIADECFMPLTVGGGVRCVDDVRRLLQLGADKVAINTAAVEIPHLVSQVASRFGSQCVVVSIDARRHPNGTYEVWTHAGTRAAGVDPMSLAKKVESCGAGEILLTSIERDGTLQGYDVELTRSVGQAVSIPVIASGGAGVPEHFAQVLRDGGASAVAAASCYHFTQLTPLEVKQYLRQQGFPVRL